MSESNCILMTEEAELKEVFVTGFNKLKQTFYRNYKIEEREEDSIPHVLALRDMIESLPPATHVIEITGPSEHTRLTSGRGFLFKYDFDRLKSDQFEFCGTVDYRQPEHLIALLSEKCDLKGKEISGYVQSLCKDFRMVAMWDPPNPWYLHFIPDDIVKQPEVLYRDLVMHFLQLTINILYDKFRRPEHPDYNKIFNLFPDPILSEEELLQVDKSSKIFGLTLQRVQEHVQNLQLIPSVPESVKQTFKRAKDLFIFGHFRYEFFTIAQHYAYLALEAAIKARYIASLGDVAVLTDKRKGLRQEMRKPEYWRIERFCRQARKDGWNVQSLMVNGEPFPHSSRKLIQWIVDKHIIRKWEARRYDAGLQLRNSLSHLERTSVFPPSMVYLENVVQQINYLFYTLQEKGR